MNIGIFSNTGGQAPSSSFPGFPNVNDGADAYIRQLLTETPQDQFFSSLEQQQQKSGSSNTLLKWGAGILTGVLLWQLLLRRKGGDFIRRGIAAVQRKNPLAVVKNKSSQLGHTLRSIGSQAKRGFKNLGRLAQRLKL
ncbi:MAG TPA: hypothetical protein V6C99_09540 [Oculatellaceae cyanobacterium]